MPIIINGASRRAGGWWAKHLTNKETNERVDLVEMRGLAADTVRDAFREMQALAIGTKCANYFYQANINPRADEHLTPEQWAEAVDTLERNLGFSGQPRFVVEHEKAGRTHRHVVWSRIDIEQQRALPDSLTAPIHEQTSRELEIAFGLEPGKSILVPDRDFARPERGPEKWERFRGDRHGIDPADITSELTELWQASDNGQSFRAAIEQRGYVLARGDRRDFVILDKTGDVHSLARRLEGVRAKDVRERMQDIDPASLPSVADAKTLIEERQQAPEYYDRDAADAAWQDQVVETAITTVPPESAMVQPENTAESAAEEIVPETQAADEGSDGDDQSGAETEPDLGEGGAARGISKLLDMVARPVEHFINFLDGMVAPTKHSPVIATPPKQEAPSLPTEIPSPDVKMSDSARHRAVARALSEIDSAARQEQELQPPDRERERERDHERWVGSS